MFSDDDGVTAWKPNRVTKSFLRAVDAAGLRRFRRHERLTERAVVVNPEVKVSRTRPSGIGDRTDVQIDAVSVDSRGAVRDVVRVPIEVKGAWNREVPTAIDDQLAGRYMGDLHTNVGIYVVVWPGDSHWSETDGRRSQVPDRRQTVEQLRMQAASYAESGRTIEVVHIDIPYERADLDHKPDPKAYGDG